VVRFRTADVIRAETDGMKGTADAKCA